MGRPRASTRTERRGQALPPRAARCTTQVSIGWVKAVAAIPASAEQEMVCALLVRVLGTMEVEFLAAKPSGGRPAEFSMVSRNATFPLKTWQTGAG